MNELKSMSVWRVCGTLIDYEGENQILFEAYFTTRDAAHAVYHRGEHEYGLAFGYTDMTWTLEGFYVDNDQHIDQMFEDVKERLDMLFPKDEMMQEHWGERCPDYEPECSACKAWEHYDKTGEVMR